MTAIATGPLATELASRLTQALAPTHLVVSNDSAKHHGHSGDDGSGESHFSVEIESAAFAGLNRVARQRLVNQALGHMLEGRIHALALKTRAPGE